MIAKISVFATGAEEIIYLLLYNLHDYTFKYLFRVYLVQKVKFDT